MLDPRGEKFVRDFGEHLLRSDLLDETALQRAAVAQRDSGERFDDVLIKLGLVDEGALIGALAHHLSLRRFEVQFAPSLPVAEVELPSRFVRSNELLPIAMGEDSIQIALSDPFKYQTLQAISYKLDREVECFIASSDEINQALDALYPEGDERLDEENHLSSADHVSSADLERLKEIAREAPVVQLVGQIITKAIDDGASDIHIESLEDRLAVRYRLDGVLQNAGEIPAAMQAAVISRLKILSGLNIAERRLPQDGHITQNIRGREIDLRVSTVPTVTGETVVLRILDSDAVQLDFAALGFAGGTYEKFRSLLDQPNGIILVTGPTGSGKTTTLYTSLNALNDGDRKILTVEDPVEYHVKGINQIQVQPSIGLTFVSALKSILRQDPDIILIGEIRDRETAEIAVQAALTGHLVFATLHTNDAASSLTRLRDLGIEDFMLGETVIGALAQRLVRKLCAHCSESETDPAVIQRFNSLLAIDWSFYETLKDTQNLRRAVGCDHCRGTGYSGRTALHELLYVDIDVKNLISKGHSTTDISKLAFDRGMISMKRHGFEKIARGETTLEEVLSVIRDI